MAGTEVKVPEEHDGEGDETQDEEENGLPDYVELGFPSARGAPAALTPFVSRVGGRPSWLVPDALPSIEAELLCANCSMPMTLLVHLYAPDERFERSYHRVVQVYCCRIGKCHAKPAEQCFRVLRFQLPKSSAFYENTAPNAAAHRKGQPFCVVCGLPGPKQCGKCHRATYCSRDHQILHWNLVHKPFCSPAAQGYAAESDEARQTDRAAQPVLFPCIEIEMEEEWIDDTAYIKERVIAHAKATGNPIPPELAHEDDDEDESDEEGPVINSSSASSSSATSSSASSSSATSSASSSVSPSTSTTSSVSPSSSASSSVSPSSSAPSSAIPPSSSADDAPATATSPESGSETLPVGEATEPAAPENAGASIINDEASDAKAKEYRRRKVDQAFLDFQRRVSFHPQQVLRYARLAGESPEPLWVNAGDRPTAIPPCNRCGGPRDFEFQILPQMLNHLRVDDTQVQSVDWGTLVVYSCVQSCDVGQHQYAREVVWRQMFSADGLEIPTAD